MTTHVKLSTSLLEEVPTNFENQMMKIFFGASEPDEFTRDQTDTVELKCIISDHRVTHDLFRLLADEELSKVISPRKLPKQEDAEFESEQMTSDAGEGEGESPDKGS